MFDRVGLKWDSVPVSNVKLDHAALDFLREHALEKNRLTKKAVSVSDETLIKNLKILTNNGEYTRAAAMLFGDTDDVVFGSYVRIGFFENGRLKYQDEVHGPLISQALVDIEGLQRTETYMTTDGLLREVILNAVDHKYYPSNLAIKIRVTDDHITVVNEGYWPFDRLPVEDVYEGEHSSYPPNPLIGNGLFFAGAMDTWGQGFQLIKEECEKVNAPLPEIKATEKCVEITVRPCAKYMELLNSGTNLGDNLGTSAEDKTKLLLAFCDEPRSKADIQENLSIKSESYVRQKLLAPLLRSGQLRRTIPDKPNSKNQKYITTKTEMERAQAIMDNNPVLKVSPVDLKRGVGTVEEYLKGFSQVEQKLYYDYYEDEM